MRECRDSVFLTLVVPVLLILTPTFCWSAPNNDPSPSILKESIQDVNDPSLSESAFQYKKEDQIMRLELSLLHGDVTKKISKKNQTATGFAYDWRDFDQNYWSLSAKWLDTEAAWIEAGKKFMIFPENLYEPYYKLSLSHFMDPDDSIAGLTRIDSYKGAVAVGLLDLWTLGRILNFEVGAQWGIPGAIMYVQTGAQWSF